MTITEVELSEMDMAEGKDTFVIVSPESEANNTTAATEGPSSSYSVPPAPPREDEITFGPVGTFKHTLCSCCDVCLTSTSLMCLATFCSPCLYGQLMTRMKLGCFGVPSEEGSKNTCAWIAVLTGLTWLVFLFLDTRPLLFFVFWLYVCFVATRTRGRFRQRFGIPPSLFHSCEGGLDDCLIGFCCACCSGIQMARHTHDEDRYPYTLCADTGLPTYAPEIPFGTDVIGGGSSENNHHEHATATIVTNIASSPPPSSVAEMKAQQVQAVEIV